ncbi:MFS transporter [Alkalimonas collagenimarina]|uniref:MFS transporter n=1 Tax=Alkalimonas collagenimarina TaxID=400390 RepID=A0ABT9GY43_9GAMM|nr:MFS transporter [Alkalimonas collagenimarina]MDP4535979.1 MFS transporter [Alkalimonas collagenimarina]
MAKTQEKLDRLYGLIANEEDARACKDISDQACTEVPRNFFLILCSQTLTSLGDLLTSPKTILTWLMTAVGAPAALIAWLVPIRESGSMLPQLMIGAWVRQHALRKPFLVLGAIIQALSLFGMVLVVLWLEGLAAGLAILGLLVVFSLGRGLNSVAMKDVQGKTIPKQRRGRLTGLASTISGLLTTLISVWLFSQAEDAGLLIYVLLLLGAAMLWFGAATLFSQIDEQPGETSGGGNAMQQAFANLALLRDDALFRHFVITRALMLSSALATPFLIVLAQQHSSSGALLGAFLLASSLASLLSSSIWGWMADWSSRKVLLLAAGLASVFCFLAALASQFDGLIVSNFWFYPTLFMLLSIAHAGVRVGRKTYLLDMAGGNKRTDYVSVSNTVIGALLLLTGLVSALVASWSLFAVLVLFALMSAVGVIYAWRLKEVTQ